MYLMLPDDFNVVFHQMVVNFRPRYTVPGTTPAFSRKRRIRLPTSPRRTSVLGRFRRRTLAWHFDTMTRTIFLAALLIGNPASRIALVDIVRGGRVIMYDSVM